MTLPSDAAVSRGDVMRRLAEIERQVRELAAARRLQASSISSGGITVDGLSGAETFIGSDIPAPVLNFYNFFGFDVLAVTIYRFDADNYVFDAMIRQGVHNNQILARGAVIGGEFFSGSQVWVGQIGGGQFAGVGTMGAGSLYVGTALFPFSTLRVYNNFEIGDVNQGRGRRDRIDSAANSAAVGAEAVVLTGNSMTFEDGRCYAVKIRAPSVTSVANVTTYRVRKTNLAGTLLSIFQFQFGAAEASTIYDTCYIKRTAGSNLTDNLVLTLQASAGTTTMGGASNNVRYMEVYDCGEASQFANAIAI